MACIELNVDHNRVESGLAAKVVLENGVVREARTAGTLYRGFEQILESARRATPWSSRRACAASAARPACMPRCER